jgi:hypothetical protein
MRKGFLIFAAALLASFAAHAQSLGASDGSAGVEILPAKRPGV